MTVKYDSEKMRFACWIPKATDTHSEYVTRITFPLLQPVARTLLNVTLYRVILPVLDPRK